MFTRLLPIVGLILATSLSMAASPTYAQKTGSSSSAKAKRKKAAARRAARKRRRREKEAKAAAEKEAAEKEAAEKAAQEEQEAQEAERKAQEDTENELTEAEAAERNKNSIARRGIVLDKGAVRVDASFVVALHSDAAALTTNASGGTGLGIGIGISEDFEIGASRARPQYFRYAHPVLLQQEQLLLMPEGGLLPLQLFNETSFLNMSGYARYRFFKDDIVEVGLDVDVVVPTRIGAFTRIGAALPMRIHAGTVAIDLAPTFRMGIPDEGLFFQFGSPFEVNIEIYQGIYAALVTGFYGQYRTNDFLGFVGNELAMSVPFQLAIGYTLNLGTNARVDAEILGGYYDFIKAGDLVRNAVDPKVFHFQIGLRLYAGG